MGQNMKLSSETPVMLDVGCGHKKIKGTIGIDHIIADGVDVVHDLNVMPWPFEDSSFDRIYANHSISHLEDICKVMVEFYRIAKKDALIEIVAPHYSSDNYKTDPTHKIHLGARSMNYFVTNVDFDYYYLPEGINFELMIAEISFRETPASWRNQLKLNPIRWLGLEAMVNRMPRIYERFFTGLMPASEVRFLLKVIKNNF